MSTFNTLQTKILNLLARRDYSYKELVNKMLLKKFLIEQIHQDFKVLVDRGWINDDRLADNLIRSYQEYKGINWIKQKLQMRQIERTIIEKAIQKWQEEQATSNIKNNLDQLKQKVVFKYKIESWKTLDWDIKQKVFGFLMRSGFTNVGAIIREWQEEE